MARRPVAEGRTVPAGSDRTRWQLKLLGTVAASFRDKNLALSSRKCWALLGYLALSDAAEQTRERLIGVLWSEATEGRARASLRQALYEIRTAFEVAGLDILSTSKTSVALERERLDSDVWQIVAEAKEGRVHPLLLETERLTDTLLADFESVDPEFRSWLIAERQSINDQLLRHMSQALATAAGPERARIARALLNLDPTNEEAVRTLMRLSMAAGDIGAALAAYKRLWDLLAEEFDVEPSKETQELVATIKLAEGSPSLAPGADTAIEQRLQISTMQGPATLAIFVRGASDQQARTLEDLLTARRESGVKMLPADQEKAWLVEISSAGEAAKLAFELQAVCRSMPDGGPQLLMGAHISSSSFGDATGFHRAIAQVAGPGQLTATDDFRDQLTDGIDATVRDLGFVEAPRAGERVRAFTVTPPEISSQLNLMEGARLRPAIAVLPFGLVEAEDDSATLGELLAEETISALSLTKDLDVVSRLSSRNMTLQRFDIGEIAARLHADYLLAGKPRANSRTELVFELTDAESRAVRWAQVRDVGGLDTLRARELAEWIAAEVRAAILVSESERAASNPLRSLQSYTILFAGITLMDRWTRTSFDRSRELLNALHERTPSHPLPNAWLAAWHIRSISQGWTRDAAADGIAAIDFAQRSLDADPHCSLALAMEGWANVHAYKRLDVAQDRFSLAVESNPNDSLAWLLKGVTHAFAGEGDPAVVATRRALRLSPLDPRRSYFESMAATAELAAGHYDIVIELAKRSLRANRLHASTLRTLATAQWASGRHAEARQTVTELLAVEPSFRISSYLANHPAMHSQFGRSAVNALRSAGVPL